MAKNAGRLCLIKKAGTAIAGLLTNSISVAGDPIDIHDKGDLGIVEFLSNTMTNKVLEIGGEGYEEDNILRDIALGADSGKFLTDITYVFANGDSISGNFVLTAYSENADRDDGEKFNASFKSNGAWTFSPAA